MKRREPLAGSRKPESMLSAFSSEQAPGTKLTAKPACVGPAFRLPATDFRLPSSNNHFDCNPDHV